MSGSNVFGVINWNSPAAIRRFRWAYCYNRAADLEYMTDFTAYLVHRAMSDHPAETISAPDRAFPELPERAAKTFAYLSERLAKFEASVPPLTERDRRCLAAAAELDALPDNYWHESGRWMVTPRVDAVWDRVKARIAAEAEASAPISAADKKRAEKNAKRLEQMRARQYRRVTKELDAL